MTPEIRVFFPKFKSGYKILIKSSSILNSKTVFTLELELIKVLLL